MSNLNPKCPKCLSELLCKQLLNNNPTDDQRTNWSSICKSVPVDSVMPTNTLSELVELLKVHA